MKGSVSVFDVFADKWANCVKFVSESAEEVLGPAAGTLTNSALASYTAEGALVLLAMHLPPIRKQIEDGNTDYFRDLIQKRVGWTVGKVPEMIEQKALAYARFFLYVLDTIGESDNP